MKALAEQIGELDGVEVYGRGVGVRGLMIEVAGPIHTMSIGARVVIETGNSRTIPCEVVGFSGANALLMPFAALEGVRRGCRAVVSSVAAAVRPSPAWLGRVVNAMGEPIDGKGALPPGPSPYPFRNPPPPAHAHFLRLRRRQIGAAVDAGAQRRRRYFGDRAGRRARPRGAGIPAGRSRCRGPQALRGGGVHLGRARSDAPASRLPDARGRRIFPR